MHAPQPLQEQSASQVRSCRLQAPPFGQVCTPVSPPRHSPSPWHSPSAPQFPSSSHVLVAAPHAPQASSRVCPGAQVHSVGAVQSSHTPAEHVVVPSPHIVEHGRTVPALTSGS